MAVSQISLEIEKPRGFVLGSLLLPENTSFVPIVMIGETTTIRHGIPVDATLDRRATTFVMPTIEEIPGRSDGLAMRFDWPVSFFTPNRTTLEGAHIITPLVTRIILEGLRGGHRISSTLECYGNFNRMHHDLASTALQRFLAFSSRKSRSGPAPIARLKF